MEPCQGSEFSTFPWRDTTGVPTFVEVLHNMCSLIICLIFSDNFKCQSYTKTLVILRHTLSIFLFVEPKFLSGPEKKASNYRRQCKCCVAWEIAVPLHMSCQASKNDFAIISNPISSQAWAPPPPVGLLQISQSVFMGQESLLCQVCSRPRLGVWHLLLVAAHVHMQPPNLRMGCWVINHAGTITY